MLFNFAISYLFLVYFTTLTIAYIYNVE